MEEVASRYAAAIVSIAKDENKLEQYKLAILDVEALFESNPELLKFLKSYFVKTSEKYSVIEGILSKYRLENLNNFIKLLVEKHQIHNYKNIVKEVTKGINFELDIYEGFVYSTEPLINDKVKEIADAISKKLNRKVELKNKIDPRLIGGVKVVVHDHVFDGSLKHKLETMKENLKERRNG